MPCSTTTSETRLCVKSPNSWCFLLGSRQEVWFIIVEFIFPSTTTFSVKFECHRPPVLKEPRTFWQMEEDDQQIEIGFSASLYTVIDQDKTKELIQKKKKKSIPTKISKCKYKPKLRSGKLTGIQRKDYKWEFQTRELQETRELERMKQLQRYIYIYITHTDPTSRLREHSESSWRWWMMDDGWYHGKGNSFLRKKLVAQGTYENQKTQGPLFWSQNLCLAKYICICYCSW